jgi:hypothetical protein
MHALASVACLRSTEDALLLLRLRLRRRLFRRRLHGDAAASHAPANPSAAAGRPRLLLSLPLFDAALELLPTLALACQLRLQPLFIPGAPPSPRQRWQPGARARARRATQARRQTAQRTLTSAQSVSAAAGGRTAAAARKSADFRQCGAGPKQRPRLGRAALFLGGVTERFHARGSICLLIE